MASLGKHSQQQQANAQQQYNIAEDMTCQEEMTCIIVQHRRCCEYFHDPPSHMQIYKDGTGFDFETRMRDNFYVVEKDHASEALRFIQDNIDAHLNSCDKNCQMHIVSN